MEKRFIRCARPGSCCSGRLMGKPTSKILAEQQLIGMRNGKLLIKKFFEEILISSESFFCFLDLQLIPNYLFLGHLGL